MLYLNANRCMLTSCNALGWMESGIIDRNWAKQKKRMAKKEPKKKTKIGKYLSTTICAQFSQQKK